MNFLNFLTAGASLFNFNLQNLASSSVANNQVSSLHQKIDETQSALSAEETARIKQQMEMLTQKQQLINQYMHLNIQLLSQKLENLQKIPANQQKPKPTVQPVSQSSDEQKLARKKNKKINKCGHDDKLHYAKGLCNNCYHKYGRNKKPTKCPHDKLYAAGMCQNCYINNYNRKKRLVRDHSQVEYTQNDLKIQMQQSIQQANQNQNQKQKEQQVKQ